MTNTGLFDGSIYYKPTYDCVTSVPNSYNKPQGTAKGIEFSIHLSYIRE